MNAGDTTSGGFLDITGSGDWTNVVIVPEPGALALACLGVGVAAWVATRQRRSSSLARRVNCHSTCLRGQVRCRVWIGILKAMRISVGLVLSVVCTATWADDLLPSFGGRFPHLAVSNARGECGIGAVVPWADRLWLTAYAPQARHGSDDKLYSIDDSLRLTARPESVGGTPATRFINDATGQSVIGPYVIDRQGTVRPVPPKKMEGRISAAAAHPLDPAGKVLVYDMEGLLYELAMRSLEPRLLVARAVPGWHGKGMYAGQGGVVHLAHGADTPVTFTLSAGAGTAWQTVATVDVRPGSPSVHEFLAGFLAQWVRFTADAPCRATAALTYR